MMKRFASLTLVIMMFATLLPLASQVQASDYSFAGLIEKIASEAPMKYIEKLSSKEFRGRMVGDPGEKITTDYIASLYKSFGLKPAGDDDTYFQNFSTSVFLPKSPVDFRMVTEDGGTEKQFVYKKDYNFLQVTGSGKANADAIFAGFGISTQKYDYDDYKGIDAKGKVVAVIRHAPDYLRELAGQEADSLMAFQYKVDNAIAHGASAVVVFENPMLPPENRRNMNEKIVSAYPSSIPCFFVSVECSNQILSKSGLTSEQLFKKINDSKSPSSFQIKNTRLQVEVNAEFNPAHKTSNVVGYIAASDPFGANETVLITAHYDHLGVDVDGTLYPGACDNASGIASMLEIARVFTDSGLKPKINICFAALSGEELGLVGASYMANNPPFPLDGMTVLNLDMVCGEPNRINLSMDANFTDLFDKLKFSGLKVGADVRQGRPANNNDSAAFYAKGVPSVFIFGGRGMMWHDPEDTIEHVNPEGLQLCTRFAALTACLYAEPFFLALDSQSLESPAPDYVVSGYTGRGARVTIGGRQTIASETGKFSIPVTLGEGKNDLKVTATKPSSGEKIEKTITVSYVLQAKAELSTSMLNFGFVTQRSEPKTITFTITNTGKGPLSGTLKPCSDWLEIKPAKLNPDKTVVEATLLPKWLIPKGFHICMIQIETSGGMVFLPVTAVTGEEPTVELIMTPGSKRVKIQGDDVPVSQGFEVVSNANCYPSSALSMSFGMLVKKDADGIKLTFNDEQYRLWTGSAVGLKGNVPFTLKKEVYENKDEVMLPESLLEIMGMGIEKKEGGQVVITYDMSKIAPFSAEIFPPDFIELEQDTIYSKDFSWMTRQSFKFTPNRSGLLSYIVPDWLHLGNNYSKNYPVEGGKTIEIWPFPNNALINQLKPKSGKIEFFINGHPVGSVEVKLKYANTKRIISIVIGSKTATIDGEEKEVSPPAFIEKGTTYVPYRFIGEPFGAKVEWVQQTRSVRATIGTTTIELTINSKKAIINGVPTTLQSPAIIKDGRTFVPIRFIGEAFGADVSWDQKTKTVLVTLDLAKDKPLVDVDKNNIDIQWHDATPNAIPPKTTVTIINKGGGKIIFKEPIDTTSAMQTTRVSVSKEKVTLTPIFGSDLPIETSDAAIVATYNGIVGLNLNVGIYPKDSVLFSSKGDFYKINGFEQQDQPKVLDGLVSTSVLKFISSCGGSSIFDPTSGNLAIMMRGKTLELGTKTGDFFLDGTKMPWKFRYEVKGEDVMLPWACLSLAFGLEISENYESVRVWLKKEPQPLLSLDWPSIDLVKMNDKKVAKPFEANLYPIRENAKYSLLQDQSQYKLFFFYSNNQACAKMIPFIESTFRRYKDKGLSCYLVSNSIPTDSTVEQFFAGNRDIMEGLDALSIVGLTLPIMFNESGEICEGFPGESIPRLYIVNSKDELVFALPDANQSQLIYLEQATASIFDKQGAVPPDVLTVNVSNKGGSAGQGSITSNSPLVNILTGTFRSSPVQVSLSFDPSQVELENTPNYKIATATLLGTSNQVEIPVRCWNIPPFTSFSSWYNGSKTIRINGSNVSMPVAATAGDDPVGPIGLIAKSIGAEVRILSNQTVRFIAGQNEATMYIGQNFAESGGSKFEFGGKFSIESGEIYGPVKFLSQFAGATLQSFDGTIVLWAPTIRGRATTPLLSVDKSSLMFNSYIPPAGGFRAAPDFELPSYPYSSGAKTKLSELLKKPEVQVVIIDFWATWCPPCKSSMPHLEKLWRNYKNKGLVVLGVITDQDEKTDEDIEETLTEDSRIKGGLKSLGLDKITYPMCYDIRPELKTFRLYEGKAIPRLVVITKDMKWAYTNVGFWDQGVRNLEFKVRRLLGIEESAKAPSLSLSNIGVGELSGTITSSLPYITPKNTNFSTTDSTSIEFSVNTWTAPVFPETGTITIESNGGKFICDIQYNPVFENKPLELKINTTDSSLTFNNLKTKVSISTKTFGDKYLVAINSLLPALGGSASVLPDRKRALGQFETWQISVEHNKTAVSAGPFTLNAQAPTIIEGGDIFVDFETLCDIIGAEASFENENKTLVLRYEI